MPDTLKPARRWHGLLTAAGCLSAAALTLPGAAWAAGPRYTVHFDSTMTESYPGVENEASGKFTNEYTATVELSSPAKGSPFAGSATGSYAQASGVVELAGTCKEAPDTNKQIDNGGNPTTFKVVSFTPGSSSGASPVLSFNIGMPTENYLNEVTAPACNPGLTTPLPHWFSDWTAAHRSALLSTEADAFQLTLNRGSGEDAGSIDFSGVVISQGNLNVTETTTITVKEASCTVPGVIGEPLSLAEEAIEEAGCTVGAVTMKKSSAVAIGKVMSSAPAEGATESPGTPVALVVSKGNKVSGSCKVPGLGGDSLANAVKALKKAGCALGKVSKKSSSSVAKGKVVSSSPKKGAKLKGGTKVALALSSGPAKCAVPELKGDSLPGAVKALKKAGCTLGKVKPEKSAKIAIGKVIASSPKKGTKLKGSSKVALTISTG